MVTETLLDPQCTEKCHDENITEMVTETIIEQQCTGKLISISEMKQNLLNHILIYHNFCR